MRMNPTLKIFLILFILFMITYALAEGIRYRSVLGIIMALVSALALVVFLKLSRKLAHLQDQEDEMEEESIH